MMKDLTRFMRSRRSSQSARRRSTHALKVELLEDRLAPAVSSATVHFAAFGDYGSSGSQELSVANLVHSWNPDFVVTLGDNNYSSAHPTVSDYNTNVGQYYQDFITGNRFFPALGDHDWGDIYPNPTGDQAYLSYFNTPGNGRYYDFVQGPVEFFMLSLDKNEPDGSTSNSMQAAWLQSELARSTSPWKVVVAPMSPFSAGTQGSWTSAEWPFQQWGASLVLSGHNHDYERIVQNGLTYVVAGTGGAGEQPFPNVAGGGIISSYTGQAGLYDGTQYAYNADFGALQVTASPTQMTLQFINEAGTVLDTYSMTNSLPTAATNLAATQVSSNQIGLTWTDNPSNELGYYIERSSDGVNFTQIAAVGKTSTSYVDSGLSTGNYYYHVDAYNLSGSSPSNTVTPTLAGFQSGSNMSHGASRLSTTVVGANQINLGWTDLSGGQDSFAVMRSTDGSSFTQIAATGPGVTTYTDTGLASATYYYRVDLLGTGLDSTSSLVASGILAPTAPSNLTATLSGTTQINLSWTGNSTNEAGFTIQRSVDGVTFTTVASVGPAVTSYADAGLAAQTTYYYQVSAYNSGGSATSNTSSATTVTVPPNPVSNITATVVSASQINLTWTPSSSWPQATSFKIYYSTDGVNYAWGWTAGQGATGVGLTSLQPSTTYYFNVKASDSAGDSIFTSPASATTMTLPAAPTNLTAAAANASQINLSWTSNSAGTETGFKIYYSTDGVNFTWGWTTGTNVTTLNATGLPAGTSFYFKVKAYNTAAGDGAFSNVVNATTMTLPAAPSNLAATVINASQINLSWTSNTAGTETGFKIYYSTNGGTSYSWGWTTGTNVTTLNATGLAAGTTYYFKVKAYNTAVGDGTFSNVVNATTMTLPAAPSNLAATVISAFQINLSWTSNSAGTESGFKIYYSTNGGTSYSWGWTTGTNVTTLNATGLAAGTTYYFKVKAYNTAVGDGTFSNVVNATTMSVPAIPTNLTATAVSSNKINLTWVNNSGGTETGFKLYYSTNGTSYSWGWTPGSGATSFTVTGSPLTASTTYYFQIKVYNAAGTSAASNTASATTSGSTAATTAPAAPSNLALTVASSSQINLAWTNNASNQNGFTIQRSTDGVNFTTIATDGANITSYSDQGRTASTTYYYRVSAYNPVGSSDYSNTANATTSAAGGGGSHLVTGSGTEAKEGIISGLGQTSGWAATLGAPTGVGVYIDNPDGTLTSDELARIEDAIATLNSATWTGSTGLNLYEVTDPSKAGIIVDNALLTQSGGQADGLLGDAEMAFTPVSSDAGYTLENGNPYLQFRGIVTVNIVEGWNWYTGANTTQIGAGQFDYETAVLHELGHAVGLYHDHNAYSTINDGHSVMFPELDSGVARRQFSSYDVAWLNHLYAYGTDPGTNETPDPADALHVVVRSPLDNHSGDLPQLPAPTPGQTLTTRPEPLAQMRVSEFLDGSGILVLLGAPDNQSQPHGSIGLASDNAVEISPAALAAVSVPATGFTPVAFAQQDVWSGMSGGVTQTIPSQSTEDGSPEQPLLPDAPTDQNLEPAPVFAFATERTESGKNLVSGSQESMADPRAAFANYFAAYGSDAIPERQGAFAPLLAAEDTETAWNATGNLAFLVLLGGYGAVRTETTEERRNRLFRMQPLS